LLYSRLHNLSLSHLSNFVGKSNYFVVLVPVFSYFASHASCAHVPKFTVNCNRKKTEYINTINQS